MKDEKTSDVELTRAKRYVFWALAMLFGILIVAGTSEFTFRVLEWSGQRSTLRDGPGGHFLVDQRWGWKPAKGDFRIVNKEFEQNGFINELFMNDDPLNSEFDQASTRIMILGDSHTYAIGASTNETWHHFLVRLLSEHYFPQRFRTYNTALPNYNLHQYLLRLIDQGPLVRPDYVIVGLSFATDFYDLIPPSHGGWYGGGQYERDYFDLNEKGELELFHWNPESKTPENGKQLDPRKVRDFLEHFATFRYLRRSKLALFIGARLTVGGESLWPNMDVVLEKEVSPDHEYTWRLFQALLLRIRDEAHMQGADFAVVGIPYLPQVYDDIWDVTFAGNDAYSRNAANERVAAFCRQNDITYVETLELLRKRTSELGRWMHHRYDAHPNAEGHEVIARGIFEQVEIRPRR